MNCSRTACKAPVGDDEHYAIWNEPSTGQPRLYCHGCGRKIVAANPGLRREIRPIPAMTIEEFLAKLKVLSTKKKFTVVGFGIRAYDGDCPVCALVEDMTKRCWPNSYFQSAGRTIGLDFDTADAIVAAADTSDNIDLRPRLLEACGLASPTVPSC
jgi:hypothetical protein